MICRVPPGRGRVRVTRVSFIVGYAQQTHARNDFTVRRELATSHGSLLLLEPTINVNRLDRNPPGSSLVFCVLLPPRPATATVAHTPFEFIYNNTPQTMFGGRMYCCRRRLEPVLPNLSQTIDTTRGGVGYCKTSTAVASSRHIIAV